MHRGEPARAEAARAALADLTVDEEDRAKHQVLSRELEAMLALRAGDTTAALTHLDRATSIEDALPAEYGPPVIVKPSHELLGEVLLQLGRFSHAQRAFERALALAPMRARSLVGLAHAAARNGDDKAAARAHTMLKEIWHSGDAGPQELGAGSQMD